MCRNIKVLYHLDPPVSDDEIRASALQYVRKISGFTKPSTANQEVFERAVEQVTAVSRALLDTLVTNAPARMRDREPEEHRSYVSGAPTFGSGA